jgi:hypothetical protein
MSIYNLNQRASESAIELVIDEAAYFDPGDLYHFSHDGGSFQRLFAAKSAVKGREMR